MKKISILGVCSLLLSTQSFSADIVNGWSGETKIESIDSYWSYNLYSLASTTTGCGSDDKWKLNLPASGDSYLEARKQKLAHLLAAYMAGKTIDLRCENSQVTDFKVKN